MAGFNIGTDTVIDEKAGVVFKHQTIVADASVNGTQVKITASDNAAGDRFGFSVAIGSGRIVVGAYLDDDTAASSGSAYIFNLAGTQLAKIKASDPELSDNFGYIVAVGCGRVAVHANGDDDLGFAGGSVYLYNLNGTQLAKIKDQDLDGGENDSFGRSLAIGCGRLVVGTPYDDEPFTIPGDPSSGTFNSGAVYIYNLNGTKLAKIKASDIAASDFFGYSVAVGCGRIVVGAYDDDNGADSGSAYIFDLDGTELAKIKASDGAATDYFAKSVAIGSGRIVAGAYGDDDNGSTSGSAYIFDLNGTQIAKIKPSDGAASDYFGENVSISSGRIVVGSHRDDDGAADSGSAYIFDLDGNQLAKITASDFAASDYFGYSVAAGNGRIVVGAYQDDDLGTSSGSAYIYNLGDSHELTFDDILDGYGKE